ncbi:MAG: hypothetical protein RL637_1618 [Pseudomonadota bacterium]|jgi:outer membrane PBP1 activator LpoA protein
MARFYFFPYCATLALLCGCATTAEIPTAESELTQAQTLVTQGNYAQAAIMYQHLAEVESPNQLEYRLLTINSLLKANEIGQAKRLMDNMNRSSLSERQLQQLHLYSAQIELNTGNAEKALTRLKIIKIDHLNEADKITYYQTLAFAYSIMGNFWQSAQTYSELTPLIHHEKIQYSHYETILKTLQQIPSNELAAKQASLTPPLNGWVELAQIIKLNPEVLAEKLTAWKNANPQHPANSAFLDRYSTIRTTNNDTPNVAHSTNQPVTETQTNASTTFNKIAVFLPESGEYITAAKAVKSGLIAAFKAAQKSGITPDIKFYNHSTSTTAIYQLAIKEGAQLFIGPMDKKEIVNLVKSVELSIPVLALNYVDNMNHPKLYQFGLSLNGDVSQIALKAHQDGYKNAIVIAPKNELGKRFETYLNESWKKLNGQFVITHNYNEDRRTFASVIDDLESKLNNQNNNSPSADILILSAYPKPAFGLTTALQNHQLTKSLPIYTTAQVYTGDENIDKDSGLNNVTFCDVPWMFNQVYNGELSKWSLKSNWKSLPAGYLRLLPLGIDAFQIINQLESLKTKPYSGASGRLTIDANNRVVRELYCAKFVNGLANPIGFASENIPVSNSTNSAANPVNSAADSNKIENK